jgi:SAM-dependent methyltransferase
MEDGAKSLRAAAGGAPDLLWASAAVHHAPDPQHTVIELARALADGGVLALAEGGLPTRCLPADLGAGEEPGLEARLDVARAVWFGRMRAAQPGVVPMPYGWPDALRRAGLGDVSTRSYLLERSVPPGGPEMDDLLYALGYRIERMLPEGLLDAADRAVWTRLLDPADPVWLGRRTDLYHLAAISVHSGYRA